MSPVGFTITTGFGSLGWDGTEFVGNQALVARALILVADGVTVTPTPTGPLLIAGAASVESAWATCAHVIAVAGQAHGDNRPPLVEGEVPTFGGRRGAVY